MIQRLKSVIRRNLLNIPGWRSRRRIVVIESDDWGSVRMASPEAYNYFRQRGYHVDKDPYNRYDSLESNTDLEMLFSVLASVRDKHGNPAIFTANSLVANPDYTKIEADGYRKYHYEYFTETLKRYPNHDRVMDLYREGISNKLLKPQFHGREHLNIPLWMDALGRNDKVVHEAFRFGMHSVHAEENPVYFNEYTDALACHTADQLELLPAVLGDGINIFEKIWGFVPASFMAPCFIWNSQLEKPLAEAGIRYLQGMVNQFQPIFGTPYQYKLKYHYLGQKNKFNQRYLVRNVFFEPSHFPDADNVGTSLKRMEVAFAWGKPAIISSHRLNYMGTLDPVNRERGLKQLGGLLTAVVKKWPDVEFMTSDQLGDLISTGKFNH